MIVLEAILIRFVRSKGWTSDAIALREKTCMPFTPSHTECVTPDGKWLGQHMDGGMQARPAGYDAADVAIMPDGRRCEIIVSLPVSQAQADAFYDAAHRAIGEPYDWKAIVGFGVTFHEHQKFHAICSAKMLLLLRTLPHAPLPLQAKDYVRLSRQESALYVYPDSASVAQTQWAACLAPDFCLPSLSLLECKLLVVCPLAPISYLTLMHRRIFFFSYLLS